MPRPQEREVEFRGWFPVNFPGVIPQMSQLAESTIRIRNEGGRSNIEIEFEANVTSDTARLFESLVEEGKLLELSFSYIAVQPKEKE